MTPFDCELLRDGWPAQPANTLSALAFMGAAAWSWRRGQYLAAVAMAAAGAGSIWLHAAPGATASWAHDVGLYAFIAVAAVTVWKRMATQRPPLLAAGIFVAGVAIWSFSRTGGPLCDPRSITQGHALWHLLAASAGARLFVATLEELRIF